MYLYIHKKRKKKKKKKIKKFKKKKKKKEIYHSNSFEMINYTPCSHKSASRYPNYENMFCS